MTRTQKFAALPVLLAVAATLALAAAGAWADHRPGHGNGGGGDDNGDAEQSTLSVQYEIAASWQDIFWLGWGDLNDHGDLVVTTQFSEDWSEGWPVLSIAGMVDFDLNTMIAIEFEDDLLDVDEEIMDGDWPRALVTAEALNNAGQIAGQYASKFPAPDGSPLWLPYRYTPPSTDEAGHSVPGRLEALVPDDAAAALENTYDMPIHRMNDDGDVTFGANRLFMLYLDGGHRLSRDDLMREAGIEFLIGYGINNRRYEYDEDGEPGTFLVQMPGVFAPLDQPGAVRYNLRLSLDTLAVVDASVDWVQPAHSQTSEMRGSAVNNDGDVAGYEVVGSQNHYRAFLATDETVSSGGQVVDLGTLGGNNSRVSDLNDRVHGVVQITGRSATKKSPHSTGQEWEPYLYTGGTMHRLLEGIDGHEQFDAVWPPRRINNSGHILCSTSVYTDDGWVYGLILLTPGDEEPGDDGPGDDDPGDDDPGDDDPGDEPLVFDSTDTPKEIEVAHPRHGARATTSTIAIRDTHVAIGTFNVGLGITHSRPGDLRGDLVRPNGVELTLFGYGGLGNDGVHLFDLSGDLAGLALDGDWTLVLYDRGRPNPGTLEGWWIEAEAAP